MPVVYLPLPETYVNVTRPVNINVTEQLRKAMGIKDKDFRISYNGVAEVSKSTGSTIGDDHNLESNDPKFTSTGKFSIDVTETYSELEQHLGRSRTIQRPPIFLDRELGVFLEPQYQQMETTISINYRTEDFNAARYFTDMFRNRVDKDLNTILHELRYDYPMPKEAMKILKKIYDLRETKGGYGDTWRDWFYGCSPDHVDVLTKMDGAGGLVSFAEKQVNVLGWLEDTNPPEPARGKSGEFNISFNYRYRYDRPTGMRFVYPLMIHNSVIPSNLRPSLDTSRYIAFDGARSISEYNYDKIRRADAVWDEYINGIKIPKYDDYRLTKSEEHSTDVLRALIQVNNLKPTSLLNIRELGSYKLSEELVTHMLTNRKYSTIKHSDLFTFELFRDGHRLSGNALELNEDGSLTTKFEMSLRSTYHVKLTLLLDMTLLNSTGLKNLSRSPELALTILEAFGVPRDKLPKVVADRLIAKRDILNCFKYIKANKRNTRELIPAFNALVGKSLITVHGA